MQSDINHSFILLYCIHLNDLFVELKKNMSGCWIETSYLGYSDYNLLLASSREALQVMISICEKYAVSHDFILYHLEQALKWVVCHCCSASASIWIKKKSGGKKVREEKSSIFSAIRTFFRLNFFPDPNFLCLKKF